MVALRCNSCYFIIYEINNNNNFNNIFGNDSFLQYFFPRVKPTCNKDSEKQTNITHNIEVDKCLKIHLNWLSDSDKADK